MSSNNAKSTGQEGPMPVKEELPTQFSLEDIERFEVKAAKRVERFAMLLYFRLALDIGSIFLSIYFIPSMILTCCFIFSLLGAKMSGIRVFSVLSALLGASQTCFLAFLAVDFVKYGDDGMVSLNGGPESLFWIFWGLLAFASIFLFVFAAFGVCVSRDHDRLLDMHQHSLEPSNIDNAV